MLFFSPQLPSHTHNTHTLPSLNFFLPCTSSHSSSVEVSGLYRRSAIWAEADKSSCAGPATPAGLPEASEAWLSEAMGEICGSKGRNGMRLTCWSSLSPLLAASVYLSVSRVLTWPCTGLNPHWENCLFLKRKPTWDRMTLWFVISLIAFAPCLTLRMHQRSPGPRLTRVSDGPAGDWGPRLYLMTSQDHNLWCSCHVDATQRH